ncbi:MAG: hypothetical protein AAF629_15890 [Chloroflexota bacterium]
MGILKGVGQYITPVVVLTPPQANVESMLPEGIQLLSQTISPAGTHPVLFMYGHQIDVHPEPIPIFRLNYLEFAVSIPYVSLTKSTSQVPHMIQPRIYLNKWFPLILGYFYGLAKHKATIGADTNNYIVDTPKDNELLVSGQFQLLGEPQPPTAYPNFEQYMVDLLQQPVIGTSIPGLDICSSFTWEFDKATIQPLDAQVEITNQLTSVLPGLEPGTYNFAGIDTEPLGAFLMNTPWSFSLPTLC